VTSRVMLGIGAALAACVTLAAATLPTDAATTTLRVGPDDIGGVVTGPNGPEAGVWVIAETNDLPTKFVRIVVTDDQGRYLIPTCPRPPTTSGCAATVWWTRRSPPPRSDARSR